MECTLALVADAANLSQEGKLNILGAFTNINTKGVPVKHSGFVLVLVLEASPAEIGQTKKLEIKAMGEDGQPAWGMEGDFPVPEPRVPGEPITMSYILNITEAVFPEFGHYQIAVMVNDNPLRQIPLTVTERGNESGN